MDLNGEIPIKRIKIMNPYVQLNKAFIINSSPSIVNQFNNELTSDVKVILSDDENLDLEQCKSNTVLYLHKLVLSSGSPMFATWLNKYSDKTKDSILRIPEDFTWMSDFFRYFYTGHISMTSENLVDIYTVADKYLVESLKTHCEEYIKESLKIKVEKVTCPHVTSVLTKPPDSNILNTEPFLIIPSNVSIRSRSTNSDNIMGSNIFFRFNQSPSSKNNSLRNLNATQLNSSLFNNNNPTNIFAKKNFESVDLISECTNFNSKMDLFCSKCNPGPLTVTRILAFNTVATLAQMTCNKELTSLAKYNLMIRLTEELRSDDYSQFVQLSYELLYDLLGDDNFYCSEYHLFCGLQHWIQVNVTRNSLTSSTVGDCGVVNRCTMEADNLLGLIRFPVLSADELYEVENSARASGHFSDTALTTFLHDAMRYMVYRNVAKAKADETWNGVAYKPRIPVEILKLGMQSLS